MAVEAFAPEWQIDSNEFGAFKSPFVLFLYVQGTKMGSKNGLIFGQIYGVVIARCEHPSLLCTTYSMQKLLGERLLYKRRMEMGYDSKRLCGPSSQRREI
ncbi:hypothetical protein ACMD2_13027 [Ananas comosus]|uniref:Uncharacterized protein n=1 Tax=Ananas comosus TaxID=4615 RepID=A0A199VYC3_ANACO|nr:hypothetical protein ACMD2_13027 [Ananas comosus]